MFDELKDRFLNVVTSRITLLAVVFMILGGILVYRCFDLQIVQGEQYLNDFILKIEKSRDIASSRGRILDRNGKVLAYNELAYSVKIEDVYESGMSKSAKNKALNEDIYRLIKMIEKNGDQIITDFNIIIDEDGKFAFDLEGTRLQRFRADVYGRTTIEELKENERYATADEIIEYLGSPSRFRIGEYEEEGNSKSDFIVGKGYTREELLQMITIRYAMHLTSFRKYMGTTVAKDVSEETVAVILENSDLLPGVTIEEDTVRRYVDSEYFAHILGYTGKISSDELVSLNEEEEAQSGQADRYTINDMVGKSGIEAYMERTLQGTKGSEKVVVDNVGKTIEVQERVEPVAGADVTLTIDADFQIAIYHILEQSIAGIVADKIINAKEYRLPENTSNKEIKIPVYDVYYALINNSVIDVRRFTSENASEKEREVYAKHQEYKAETYEKLREELFEKKTPYNKLSREFMNYETEIVNMLNTSGVIRTELVDEKDPTYIAWRTEEVISLNEYLNYAISQGWIDVSLLNLEEKYVDSAQTFSRLVDYIIEMLEENTRFQKMLYKYMLLTDRISGKDICMILCEQKAVEIPVEDEDALYAGTMSAYQFIMNRINNLDITPAQLALDPCTGAVAVADPRTGQVLALVSYPGYDNNKMANSVDAEYYAKLNADLSSPLLNYATQYKAAPGSTFKLVSTTAGLMEGVIDLNTNIRCVGTFDAITPSPRCWRHSGHGNQNTLQAIFNSCNYYYYETGYRLASMGGSYDDKAGLAILEKYADMFGLTEKSGVEIAEYEPDISTTDAVRSSIGQGSNSFTAIGLTRYMATLANRGTCYNLTLLDKVSDSDGNVMEEFAPDVRNTIELPEKYWDVMHLGMRQVVEGKSYFDDLAVNAAGKTGTAEQIKSRPDHALFAGFAPYENPELAFAVRIPFGTTSDYAAQVAKKFMEYYYGLAEEEDLITGTANISNEGVSMNEI